MCIKYVPLYKCGSIDRLPSCTEYCSHFREWSLLITQRYTFASVSRMKELSVQCTKDSKVLLNPVDEVCNSCIELQAATKAVSRF
jgi:hypothetical protein